MIFQKEQGLFSTLNIQWLDITSLHREIIQWGVLCVLSCAIYRMQEMVVELPAMLEHGITCHELHHCPSFLHLGWRGRGVVNRKEKSEQCDFPPAGESRRCWIKQTSALANSKQCVCLVNWAKRTWKSERGKDETEEAKRTILPNDFFHAPAVFVVITRISRELSSLDLQCFRTLPIRYKNC